MLPPSIHFLRSRVVCAVLCLPAFAGIVRGADHFNLEENLPTRLEDAFPIAFMGREMQGFARYESTSDSEDRVTLQPRLEFGFAPNWQATIEAPFLLGGADDAGSGDVQLSTLYNFNQETTLLPAFAVAGGVTFPTGEDSEGLDTRLRLIATKTLGTAPAQDRLHLNVGWTRNAANADDERENRYEFIIGYSRRIGPDATLVFDLVREQTELEDEESNLVEAGVRWALTPNAVLSLGGGVGLGDDSPEFTTTAGLQFSF